MKTISLSLLFTLFLYTTWAQNTLLILFPYASCSPSLPVYLQQLSSTDLYNKIDFAILSAEFRHKNKYAIGFSYQVNTFLHSGNFGLKILKNHGIEVTNRGFDDEINTTTFINSFEFYLAKSIAFTNNIFDYGFGLKYGHNPNLYSQTDILTDDFRLFKRNNSLLFNNMSYSIEASLNHFSKKRPRLCYKFNTSLEMYRIKEGSMSFSRFSGLYNNKFSVEEDASLLAFASVGLGIYIAVFQPISPSDIR